MRCCMNTHDDDLKEEIWVTTKDYVHDTVENLKKKEILPFFENLNDRIFKKATERLNGELLMMFKDKHSDGIDNIFDFKIQQFLDSYEFDLKSNIVIVEKLEDLNIMEESVQFYIKNHSICDFLDNLGNNIEDLANVEIKNLEHCE